MNENELSIERAFDTDALSLFNCGVREIDLLIHKKNGGLSSFVAEIPCECYLARINDEPVAVFVFSNRFISVEEKRYPCLEIEFIFLTTAAFANKRYSAIDFYKKCGFEINGDRQGNTIPMFKYLGEEL